MNPLRIAVFVLIDLILFVSAYATSMYRSLFFTSVLTSISNLPLFAFLRSLLLLIVMSIPILLIMLLVNKQWLQLYLKTIIIAHLGLVLAIWAILEVII